MKNRKGFTLVELLGCIALLGIILGMGLYVTRGTFSSTLTQLRNVSDSEVFDSARTYGMENSKIFDETNKACITVMDLIDLGYLDNTTDEEIINKKIILTRNDNYVITSINYVDICP